MAGGRKPKARHHRGGRWLPASDDAMQDWLAELIGHVEKNPKPFHPVIEEFQRFIEADPEAFMLFHQMFEQIPAKPPYSKDPSGGPQVRDYRHMLELFNAVLTRAPEYSRTGVVGFPINAILDWPMATPAGFTAFLHEKVNAHIRATLNAWGRFLASPDSRYVLSEDPEKGWFGRDARADMPKFDEEFVCRPNAPYHGFRSWDDFFTRRFRRGVRPVAEPKDDDVIVQPCESAPYRIATNVKRRDRFWIKEQEYSLEHMLAGDSFTDRFVGGTVYQAFLSALSYHRWHAPVSGTVVKAYLQPGTYYSETPAEGFDPTGPTESQAYLAQVATRAIIFIEADNPRIGLMCFLGIGMAEVSTCQIGVYEGQKLSKGEEIGMFHYGGSTQCLLFRPEVKLAFDLHGQEPGVEAKNILVRDRIATVS